MSISSINQITESMASSSETLYSNAKKTSNMVIELRDKVDFLLWEKHKQTKFLLHFYNFSSMFIFIILIDTISNRIFFKNKTLISRTIFAMNLTSKRFKNHLCKR
jgi:hypothetical protein